MTAPDALGGASAPSRGALLGLRVAAWAGLLALEYGIAVAYLSRGTWWHYLLHQLVGWGLGLAVAAAVAALTRYRLPAVLALVAGQAYSIVPDLVFRYARMPHEASMDVYAGHISIHRGPAPVVVALLCVLLGGWAFAAAAWSRRRVALVLAASSALVVAVACLLAAPVPARLSDYPRSSAPVP